MKSSELGLPVGINADFSKLRFWGLIYKDLKINRDKWMMTKKGIDFLFNDFEVPKYLFIYNNDVQSYSEEFITSLEILSQKQKEINTNTVLEEAEPVEVIRIQREKDIKEIVR